MEEMLPLGKYEDKRKLLGLERKQEYNDYLKHLSPRSRHHTWKELSKEDLVPMGKYEDTWEKLRQDREERLRSRGVSKDGKNLLLLLTCCCFCHCSNAGLCGKIGRNVQLEWLLLVSSSILICSLCL